MDRDSFFNIPEQFIDSASLGEDVFPDAPGAPELTIVIHLN